MNGSGISGWNDERLAKVVSVLLIAGVTLAALVVLAGGACYLSRHGHEQPGFQVFHSVDRQYRSIGGVLAAAGRSDCRAIIQLGLLLLISTPIARVAFSMAGFAFARDWTYVGLTAVVLAILIYGLAFPH